MGRQNDLIQATDQTHQINIQTSMAKNNNNSNYNHNSHSNSKNYEFEHKQQTQSPSQFHPSLTPHNYAISAHTTRSNTNRKHRIINNKSKHIPNNPDFIPSKSLLIPVDLNDLDTPYKLAYWIKHLAHYRSVLTNFHKRYLQKNQSKKTIPKLKKAISMTNSARDVYRNMTVYRQSSLHSDDIDVSQYDVIICEQIAKIFYENAFCGKDMNAVRASQFNQYAFECLLQSYKNCNISTKTKMVQYIWKMIALSQHYYLTGNDDDNDDNHNDDDENENKSDINKQMKHNGLNTYNIYVMGLDQSLRHFNIHSHSNNNNNNNKYRHSIINEETDNDYDNDTNNNDANGVVGGGGIGNHIMSIMPDMLLESHTSVENYLCDLASPE